MLQHRSGTPANPSRVVILGSSGFVGRALMSDLTAKNIPNVGFSSADLDLAKPDAAAKLAQNLRPEDSLVVLAALTPDKGRGIAPFQANIAIMASVAEALKTVQPAHVVYFSSDAVYPFRQGLVSEDTAAEPTDLYGAMHLTRELMLKEATKAPVAILRPTLIYGVEDTHNSYGPNRFRRMAFKDGKITMFGEGEETRDHIHVSDVAKLTMLVLQHRSHGLLNVATGSSVSYFDLAHKIKALFNGSIDVAGTLRATPITHRHFDVTVRQHAFPDFAPMPLDDGLKLVHGQSLAAR